jgi:hypothetical protein
MPLQASVTRVLLHLLHLPTVLRRVAELMESSDTLFIPQCGFRDEQPRAGDAFKKTEARRSCN